jgi:hypothetical protein
VLLDLVEETFDERARIGVRTPEPRELSRRDDRYGVATTPGKPISSTASSNEAVQYLVGRLERGQAETEPGSSSPEASSAAPAIVGRSRKSLPELRRELSRAHDLLAASSMS